MSSVGRCLFEVELLDSVADLVAVQAEQRRRARLVPAGPLERLDDQRAFELFEIDARRRQFDAVVEARRAGAAEREVAGGEGLATRWNARLACEPADGGTVSTGAGA